jgi:ATP-dependent Clp protease ATP-binding subunit ClpX
MPASPTAIALLEYGRLLWHNSQKSPSDREESKIAKAEEQLIALLHNEPSTALRGILNYSNSGKCIDPTMLRVLCMVAHVDLCTIRLGTTVAEVACGIAGEDPARILETRHVISSLLIRGHLALRDEHSDCIVLDKAPLAYFSGGADAPPLVPTESSLRESWRKSQVQTARRKAKEPASLPSASTLATEISKVVIGLDDQVRTLSCRLALHLRRAAMIRSNRDPGTANEALLFIGPSGCGKTWLSESAGRISGLPFSSISSGDITAQGYVGLDLSDCLRPLLSATNGDVVRAQSGLVLLDEWDKRAATTTHWRDIGGACVQQEMLRLMEGTTVQVGGRRGGYDYQGVLFDTHPTMWLFAGAFVGLGEMIQKGNGQSIGFHDMQRGSSRASALYDGLERFGLLPEFLNRLSGIIVFPEPTVTQVTAIITRSIVPSFNRVLATFGASIEVSEDGIRLAAEVAVHTMTYARGARAVVSSLIEDIVFNQDQGTIRLGIADVQRAIESAGLAPVAA